ncbi:ligase-associated DNA damage response endonuclease PdeM [Sedimentitalea xiamensis]|uniref:ligase-associated DNA damage response endonuclease PdeM n=1 Tax=Sedimentitalea xiamensis TaxID=3050037 RepID=UPI00389ADD61
MAGASLVALGSGALWWPEHRLLCVSDLHLGKSVRLAKLGGSALPPYDSRETLSRLSDDIDRTGAAMVICLGDSFDDLESAAGLPDPELRRISRLQAGRRWIWIEGNHDPGPVSLGGMHLGELTVGPLTFRHIADPAASAEVSGHFHPKVHLRMRGHSLSRPAFLLDDRRLVLPAYGSFTGGLRSTDRSLTELMRPGALALLTGPTVLAVPMPR